MVGTQQIATWKFETSQLRWERMQFYRALRHKVIRHIESQSGSFPELAAQVAELDKQKAYMWIAPELVYLGQSGLLVKQHPHLESYLHRAHKLLRDMEHAASLPDLRVLPEVKSFPTSETLYYAEVGLEQIRNSFDPNLPITMRIGTPLARRTADMIEEALSALQTLAPAVHEELTGIVREVVLLDGSGLRSSSVPLTFGLVFLQPDATWQLPKVVDLLVHECAHHSLVMKTSLSKMVTDSQRLIRSPLREDARPVNAVLHAVFVLMRVCHVMTLWLEAGLPDQDIANALLTEYSERLREGIATLETQAEWTESGAVLFAELSKGSEGLSDAAR